MRSSLRSSFLALAAVGLLTAAVPTMAQHYNRIDLTSDITATSPTAPHQDPNLVNAWGLSRSSGSPWWVADNGKGVSTLYDGTGTAQSLVVTIPLPNGGNGLAAPTGTVFNFTTAFQVATGKPAIFLFVTEDGTISGWNPTANATNAIRMVDRSEKAIYKGMAIAQTPKGPRLYATNFKSGRVEVFDDSFQSVHLDESAFRAPHGRDDHRDDAQRNFRHDSRVPKDLVPFNIVNIGGNLLVNFAVRTKGETDEQHGPGFGASAIYDTQGRLLLTLEGGDWFNAPWGAADAPGDFGAFAHRILIGNFGDGAIHAFNAVTGKHEGQMLNPDGSPLLIDGLWAISFGANARSSSSLELYFTAGPNDEANGILGKVTAVSTENRGNSE